MPGRPRRVGENRRSRSGKARRRGGAAVLGTAAGAFLALGMIPVATAPRAHADIDDIFQPIIDAIGQAASLADPSLFSAFDPGLDLGGLWATGLAADVGAVGADFQTNVDGMIQPFVDAIGHAASSVDPGLASAAGPGLDIGSVAAPAQAVDLSAVNAIVPLQVNDVTEPVVDLSVGGGPSVPVLVDSGSDGLVIPIQDLGLQDLSFPTGLGVGSYSGGLDYVYLTFNMPVNFGDGIVTSSTSVDAELFAFPTSLQDLFSFPSLQSFLAPAGAVGVLGVGPDAVGPGPSSVISALPGDLSQGVTIDEPAGTLIFGPDTITNGVTVAGAPVTPLEVQIGHGALVPVSADVDSGGVYGTIPSSVLVGDGLTSGTVPAGTEISVYTSDGKTLLYQYMTTATDAPTVTSGDIFNTGYQPFLQEPVYIGYDGGAGATTFDGN